MPEYKSAPFTFVKHGVFYFSRRIPKDLNHHYTAGKMSFSLRTKSAVVARSRAQRAAQQLDEHWYHLRIHGVDLPGKHLLRMGATRQAGSPTPLAGQAAETVIKLSEAVSIYLRLKGKDRPVTFHRAAERSCGYVIDVCGDRDICSYTKGDANKFRDALLERELTGSSITRIFGTVRTVINFAASEVGLTLNNPFAGVYYDRTAGVEEREPLPIDAIREVQVHCREHDDDLRWLVALISDTGMRLTAIARNSSFADKGRSVDLRAVGRELGVGHVLEGSVRRAGQQVRVTAQLIDASSGAHVWADRRVTPTPPRSP